MQMRHRYSALVVAAAAFSFGACSKEEPAPVAEVAPAPPAAAPLPPPTSEWDRFTRQVVDLGGTQTGDAVTITLAGDRFAAGKSEFQAGDKIDAIAQLLQANSSTRVTIEGFTDDRGGDALNQRLSAARAESVKDALVSRGVSADRIDTTGRGSAQPVASNDTADGRAQNRRVEVTFTSDSGNRLATAQQSGGGPG